VTAHHPDGVIVGVIRSADLPWDGFGRAPRRHRSIGVTGRCRRRPATSRPRDGDPSRRHTGRPSSSPVVGSRPSNMAWNPATDASPCSPRLRAPAPYHRPGLSPWPDRYCWWSVASSRGVVLLPTYRELGDVGHHPASSSPSLAPATHPWCIALLGRLRVETRASGDASSVMASHLVEALCLMALSEGRSVRRMWGRFDRRGHGDGTANGLGWSRRPRHRQGEVGDQRVAPQRGEDAPEVHRPERNQPATAAASASGMRPAPPDGGAAQRPRPKKMGLGGTGGSRRPIPARPTPRTVSQQPASTKQGGDGGPANPRRRPAGGGAHP
jgi:hypothetical protein